MIADAYPATLDERALVLLGSPLLLANDIASCWPEPGVPGYAVAADTLAALLILHRSSPAIKLLVAQTLRALDRIGELIRKGLQPKPPKPRRRQTLASHVFETSPKGKEFTVDPKVADMIKKFALIAGFAEDESGLLSARTRGAALRLFGAKNSLSGRNHLRRFWQARGKLLNEKKSDRAVYDEAAVTLDGYALAQHSDSSSRSKPAYVLRELLDDHVAKAPVLDCSLRAASEVDLQRPFTIRLTPKMVPGTAVRVATVVNVRMEWNGTCRHDVGGAERPIFTHICRS